MQKLIKLIEEDQERLNVLDCLFGINFPPSYLAAGFVRNLVWDHLHQKSQSTPLNDVDVIYFDQFEANPDAYKEYESILTNAMPNLRWQVRNQARMHIRNKDEPYRDLVDAMSYWPEKETAVAIRKTSAGSYECIAAFGFDSLFDLKLTYNPKRRVDIFRNRVMSKGWLATWPNLTIVGLEKGLI